MTTRIWLLRHGQPDEGVERLCYGSLDVGLSDAGRRQMARAARELAAEPVAAIYSSPRQRAIESAGIVRDGLGGDSREVRVVPDFREIDFGGFEGMAYDDIAVRFPDLYRQWMEASTSVQFPGGESFANMRLRVLGAFDAVSAAHTGETAVVVTHGGPIRAIVANALGMAGENIFHLAQDHGALNRIDLVDGFTVVGLLNRCP
jgi:broad specificity phosphatase PhoE